MDQQHRGQRLGRPAALRLGSGGVRLNQINEFLPTHYLVHLSPKLLMQGALLGRSLLLIAERVLLTAHGLEPDLLSHDHFPLIDLGSSMVSPIPKAH